jgi:hypothetical protein
MSCYGIWQRGKSFSVQNKTERTKRYCSIENCENIHFGKGFCRKHYIKFSYIPSNNIKQITKNTYKKQCLFCLSEFETNREQAKYCSMKCSSDFRKKPFIIKKGYKKLLIPEHHRADKKGYVFEHIVVMEKELNRKLFPKEEIHHIDKNKENNKIDNLMLFKSHSEHMDYHYSR